MKISELPSLISLQRNTLIPVSLSNRNHKVTLGQILDEAAKAVVAFGEIKDRTSSVTIAKGNAGLTAGTVIFDTTDNRFYLAVLNTANGSGQTIESWTYYEIWRDSWQFYDEKNAVRTDAIFSDDNGRFYNFKDKGLMRAGISQEEADRIELSKWIKLTDEEEMEKLIESGQADDGKIRYTTEES